VGRLDRDTSGVVVFAKNSYMKFLTSNAMANGKKLYRALVLGCPEEKEGLIDLPIRRAKDGDMLRIVSPDGQKAQTRYRVIKSARIMSNTVSLLELELLTGRTHQIRVHCGAIGLPLLGDVLYYTSQSRSLSEKLGISAQALHAYSLSFTEPLTKSSLTINAPIVREDMNSIIAML
jgi:23S rRNA pseudouridine1911/1915/1917 synthase